MSLLSGFITAIFYNWHMNKVIIIKCSFYEFITYFLIQLKSANVLMKIYACFILHAYLMLSIMVLEYL